MSVSFEEEKKLIENCYAEEELSWLKKIKKVLKGRLPVLNVFNITVSYIRQIYFYFCLSGNYRYIHCNVILHNQCKLTFSEIFCNVDIH